jgi:hypothetical protein
MADRRDIDEVRRVARRRVGSCAPSTAHPRHVQHSRSPRDGLVRRCAASGIRLVEGGSIVRFSPWSCATCGCREDLVIAGSIAFCTSCLEQSAREDDDDVYQDTGGGD